MNFKKGKIYYTGRGNQWAYWQCTGDQIVFLANYLKMGILYGDCSEYYYRPLDYFLDSEFEETPYTLTELKGLLL